MHEKKQLKYGRGNIIDEKFENEMEVRVIGKKNLD